MTTKCKRACKTCLVLDKSGRDIKVNGVYVPTLANVPCNVKFVVYLVIGPCGKAFVGSTEQLNAVLSVLRSANRNRKLNRHIQSCSMCSWSTVKVFVLHQGTDLRVRKKYFIDLLDTVENGLNVLAYKNLPFFHDGRGEEGDKQVVGAPPLQT